MQVFGSGKDIFGWMAEYQIIVLQVLCKMINCIGVPVKEIILLPVIIS